MLKIKENILWFEANSLLISFGNILDKELREELYDYVQEVRSAAEEDEAYNLVEKILEFVRKN